MRLELGYQEKVFMVALILAFRFFFCLDVIFPEYPEFTACITSDAFAH